MHEHAWTTWPWLKEVPIVRWHSAPVGHRSPPRLCAGYTFVTGGKRCAHRSQSCIDCARGDADRLIVLGASSLCVAFLETRFPPEALRTGQVGAEVLEHQRNLAILAASTFVAAALLFATGLLAWRSLVTRMQPKSLFVPSAVFGLAYVLCSVWLIIAAHQGARMVDHLARHARP